jgi:hypothetical protein
MLGKGSGDVGSGSGEDFLLHLGEDSRDELRELMQRWDNRLTVKDLSIVEKYFEYRLSVTLQLNVLGKSYYIQFSALVNRKAQRARLVCCHLAGQFCIGRSLP